MSVGLVQGVKWGVLGRGTGLPSYERCAGLQTGKIRLIIWMLMDVVQIHYCRGGIDMSCSYLESL